MNFDDSPEEAAFRREVRQWLERNAPSPFTEAEAAKMTVAEALATGRLWQARKFEAGYACIPWPREQGGRDGSAIQQLIYRQEETRFPYPDFFAINLATCMPIVRSFGSPAQQDRYLRPGLRGDHVWCQLFSEPAAGSDLAGIRTRAVRDRNRWRVNGHKIWTSGAHHSDYGMMLVRTDPAVPKHKGLTMLIIDMRAPGVRVQPVRQMMGTSEFNEVFFDDVMVPDGDRIGDAGQGWSLAVATLMFERNFFGKFVDFIDHDFIRKLAHGTTLDSGPASANAAVRERIADLFIHSRAIELLGYRAQTALSRGQTPGPEQSIAKAVTAIQGQHAAYLAMDLYGQAGLLGWKELSKDWRQVEFSWLWGAAMRIAGGTDEILRNIIAERVLGLPPDPRVDKDIPYEELIKAG